MYVHDEHVMMDCSRVRISGTSTRPRPDFLPPLSPSQIEALDIVQSLAARLAINVRLQAGDILAFNNLGMVHARDRFVDDEKSGQKRHLLRIIARDETKAWAVPEPLDAVLRALYAHKDKDEKFDIFRNPFMFSAGH
jgi:Taurine catabolism dioxygenase TauD, TfdA family